MTSGDRRRELRASFDERHLQAGVYALRNNVTGRVLLGSAPDLAALRNKLAFAQQTNTPGALDHRLAADLRQYGIGAFTLEVLDVFDVRPDMTAASVHEDLDALEQLWREKLDEVPLY